MNLVFSSLLNSKQQKVIDGFTKELFVELNPPGVTVKVLRFDGCRKGDEVHLAISQLGIKSPWVSVITEATQTETEWSFVDEGRKLPWPLSYWKHHHRVISRGEHQTEIIDDINFECCHKWMTPFVYPGLWLAFSVRPARYKKFFEGH